MILHLFTTQTTDTKASTNVVDYFELNEFSCIERHENDSFAWQYFHF